MAVIDSDAHVLETERTWDYMLPSESSMKPRVVPTPNDLTSGGESWLVDGTHIGKARNVGHDTAREAREMADIKARLAHMDELDVDVQVLYPTIFLRPYTRRPELELAVTRSYNRWLIDIWKRAPERLRWVAVLPLLTSAAFPSSSLPWSVPFTRSFLTRFPSGSQKPSSPSSKSAPSGCRMQFTILPGGWSGKVKRSIKRTCSGRTESMWRARLTMILLMSFNIPARIIS